MPSESEEEDSKNKHILGAFSCAGGDESSRQRWRTVIFAASAVVFIVVGLLIAKHVLRQGPYDEMVSQLHPRMSSDEMTHTLGRPYSIENDIGQGPGVYESWLYQAVGTDLPLIIQFDRSQSDYALQWCAYVPDARGDEVVYALKEINAQKGYEFRAGGMRLDCHKIE